MENKMKSFDDITSGKLNEEMDAGNRIRFDQLDEKLDKLDNKLTIILKNQRLIDMKISGGKRSYE